MGKKAYIGINNSARQVKKIYVGVSDKARNVKKGYVGVNGVARQFWPNGEGLPSKSNKTLQLQGSRANMSTTTLGKYSLFGTGRGQPSTIITSTQWVDAFDDNFTNHKLTAHNSLSSSWGKEGFTTVGNYALLGGSVYDSNYIKINAYDTSLSQTTPNELSTARNRLAAATVGNYALFGGGRGSSKTYDTVDAYDKNLR